MLMLLALSAIQDEAATSVVDVHQEENISF